MRHTLYYGNDAKSTEEKGITSIAFPILGTHNGGLDKIEVLDLMHKYLEQCDIPIEIYEYDPLAPDDMFEDFMLKWIDISHSEKTKMLISDQYHPSFQ